jgi:hypothetical protein
MKLRNLLFLVVFLFATNLTTQKAEGAHEHGPFYAFDVFPLKGTSKLKDIISLRSLNSRTKYKVSRPYELICKADVLVVNFPPYGSPTTAGVRIMFDPYLYLSREISRYSRDYVSSNVDCRNYWQFYSVFKTQGYEFVWQYYSGQGGFPQYTPINRSSEPYRVSIWCRSIIVGFKDGILYRNSIFKVSDKTLRYTVIFDSNAEFKMCTNSWSDVKKWQKEGWYLIK